MALFVFRSEVQEWTFPISHKLLLLGTEATETHTGGTEPPPPPPTENYLREFYASPTGSESNPGTLAAPWSITKALSTAQAGDVVWFRGGTYSAGAGSLDGYIPAFRPLNGGTGVTRDTRVTFAAYPGETPVLTATVGPIFGVNGINYVWWDGFTVTSAQDKGSILYGTTGSRIRNCDIAGVYEATSTGSDSDGVRVEDSDNCFVEYCNIHDITNYYNNYNACGIKVYGSSGCGFRYNKFYAVGSGVNNKAQGQGVAPAHDNLAYRNYLYEVRSTALVQAADCYSNSFYENLVLDAPEGVWAIGYDASYPVNDVFVYRNTFIRPTIAFKYGEDGDGFTGLRGLSVYDNIVSHESSWEFMSYASVLPGDLFGVWDYNRYYRTVGSWTAMIGRYSTQTELGFTAWRSQGVDGNSTLGDPLFVDYVGGDFRLADNSPCRTASSTGGQLGCFANAYWLPQVGAGNGPSA